MKEYQNPILAFFWEHPVVPGHFPEINDFKKVCPNFFVQVQGRSTVLPPIKIQSRKSNHPAASEPRYTGCKYFYIPGDL